MTPSSSARRPSAPRSSCDAGVRPELDLDLADLVEDRSMAETPAWKDDFRSPGGRHFVTRREFTKSLVLVSCATFCANGALVARAALERRAGPVRRNPENRQSADCRRGSASSNTRGRASPACWSGSTRTASWRSPRGTHLGCRCCTGRTRKLHCPCHEAFHAEDGRSAGPPPRRSRGWN